MTQEHRHRVTLGQKRILDYLRTHDRLASVDHVLVGINERSPDVLKVQICYLRNAGYGITSEKPDGTPWQKGPFKAFYRLTKDLDPPFEDDYAKMAEAMQPPQEGLK